MAFTAAALPTNSTGGNSTEGYEYGFDLSRRERAKDVAYNTLPGPLGGMNYEGASIYNNPTGSTGLFYVISKHMGTAYAASDPDTPITLTPSPPFQHFDLLKMMVGCFIDEPSTAQDNIPVPCTIGFTGIDYAHNLVETMPDFDFRIESPSQAYLQNVGFKRGPVGHSFLRVRSVEIRVVQAKAEGVRLAINHVEVNRLGMAGQ
ncbi:MAG: hypothetical protein M1828_005358 [Chrysothrix sp. TS-e1954]|nr:MAG: hypothetical protein M1828_005358 [Chrysothrix sp. TS-e1954]